MLYIKENNNLINLCDATIYTVCPECGALITIVVSKLQYKNDLVAAAAGKLICDHCLTEYFCDDSEEEGELASCAEMDDDLLIEEEEDDDYEFVGVRYEDGVYQVASYLRSVGLMRYARTFDNLETAIEFAKITKDFMEDELGRDLKLCISL